MDLNDGTDLAALHQGIVDTLGAAFPGIHWEFYREDRKNLPLGDGTDKPRAYGLLQLAEMDSAEADPGTEQKALMARFECELVTKGLGVPDAKLQVRVLAGSVAAYLQKRGRWPGALNGNIQVAGCYPDDFSPELDQYEVWRVDWVQEVWLGEGVWKNTGTLPTQVFMRYVPTGETTQVAP